jgi:Platelet-activating factor acetylhydrolase, isoform II
MSAVSSSKRAIARTILLLLLTSGAFGQSLTKLRSTSAGLSKCTSVARQAPVLPQPSGKFGIGRVGFDWVDQKRPEPLSSQPNAHRELMVYLWYPIAQSRHSARGTYLPGAEDIERAPGSTRIKEQVFGHFWPLVVSGEITSHAKENAALAKSKDPFPVILFSHGGSWTSFGYTGLIEDLVSHGYVVAAIEHTYEAAAVAFADGKVISYSEENARRMEKPPGASYDEMVENAMLWIRARNDVFAADQRFALNQLVQLNKGDEKSRCWTIGLEKRCRNGTLDGWPSLDTYVPIGRTNKGMRESRWREYRWGPHKISPGSRAQTTSAVRRSAFHASIRGASNTVAPDKRGMDPGVEGAGTDAVATVSGWGVLRIVDGAPTIPSELLRPASPCSREPNGTARVVASPAVD